MSIVGKINNKNSISLNSSKQLTTLQKKLFPTKN